MILLFLGNWRLTVIILISIPLSIITALLGIVSLGFAYDLVAVPPAAELNAAHPLYGLYRFKSGFSEHITEYVGTWDLAISRSRFAAWNAIAERAAHQWAYRVRHDLLY